MSDVANSGAPESRSRSVRLYLRDDTVVEGQAAVVEGQHLSACLGSRKGWINLTMVRFAGAADTHPHIAIQKDRVLWACSIDGDIPLAAAEKGGEPRQVEIRIAGGRALIGWLMMLPRQRLSDYMAAYGELIPVHGARDAASDERLGDIVVHQHAIERLREVDVDAAPGSPARSRPDAVASSDGAARDAAPKNERPGVKHWLLSVARAAGVDGSEPLFTPAVTPVTEAWTAVAEWCRLTDDALARLVAAHYRLEVADLEIANPDVVDRIPEKVARKYGVFPLREEDGRLVLATSDPMDHDAEQALRFASRKRPVLEVAPPAAIRVLINTRYSSDRMVEVLLNSVDADLAEVRVLEDVAPESVSDDEVDAAPIIKLTNLILRDAVREGASDIHVEPSGNGGVVRLRVDGVLRHHMQIPMAALNRVISRIKILGELDIADRLRPQDGRTRIMVDGRRQDLRISTVPTRQTEKAVIRVLNPEGNRTMDDLQMPEPELVRIRRLLSYREGITVVTGPTGAGKTTTLYAALREVATGEVNVMSVEDPVEYELHGITQIQVETQRGVTFAAALRAILRQDPDIIFVGEIRDAETADVAAHASMTGHLVLATLHTNDAVSAVARLNHLGLDAATIASTLRGALAQRLLRRACPECAQPVDGVLTPEEARLSELYGVVPTVRAHGCKRCGQAGYRGRIPVVEVLAANSNVRDAIVRQAGPMEIYRAAIAADMRPLLQVALECVQAGTTTLQEVERVLGGVKDEYGMHPAMAPVAARIYAAAGPAR